MFVYLNAVAAWSYEKGGSNAVARCVLRTGTNKIAAIWAGHGIQIGQVLAGEVLLPSSM